MPVTRRSNKRKLLMLEDNNDKTSEKSKVPNNELSQKPKEGTAPLGSLENPRRGRMTHFYSKRIQRIVHVEEDQRGDNETVKDIVESALCVYNNRHGTDLELVRFSEANDRDMFGFGCDLDFSCGPALWRHLNIEARRRSVDPDDENSLLLFVESICTSEKYALLTLLLVAPTDKFNGCMKCPSFMSHPRYGFRAGFTKNSPRRSPRLPESAEKIRMASDPKLLSEDDAVKLSQFALKDYNEKHGTNLKFERAFGCNSFTCAGRLMDFTEKSTRWVHVNFEAMVGVDSWERIGLMFAELYLGNDGKYVLATLLPAEPEVRGGETCGRWRDGYPENECAVCPDEIRHPWCAYRYGNGFKNPPRWNVMHP